MAKKRDGPGREHIVGKRADFGKGASLSPLSAWKLEDAKARFSEVVRRAHSDGPQHVTLRGKDAVVVVSAEDFARLEPPSPDRLPLVPFLQSLHLDGLDLAREPDFGRDVEL